MSGIVGVAHWDGRPASPETIGSMLEALAHRGPDGRTCQTAGAFGAGHALLASTAESRLERQPWADPDGSVLVTADARLDNRGDLLVALDDGRASEVGDAELIGRAYLKWGERSPEKLLGDFAFAVWDTRTQTVFCARDHFGVRPFYYHAGSRCFAFASEIKSLLRLPEVPRQVNELRIADYLVPMFEDKAITFYRDIWRLPPGHTLSMTSGGCRLSAYWKLDPTREIRYRSDADYAEAFREIFTEAVRCRLRGTRPTGAMLSGGLDSSSIVCVARRLLEPDGRRLHTFSVVFDETPECDERQYAAAVIRQGGLQAEHVCADRLSPLAGLTRGHAVHDEPVHAPNLFLHEAVYDAAQTRGVEILLDGFDGDIVVSHGIAYLAELARGLRVTRLAREVRGLAKRFDRSPWPIVRNHAIKPLLPTVIRRLRGWSGTGRSTTFVRRAFLDRIDWAARLATLGPDPRSLRSARSAHHASLISGLIPYTLEVADRAAAVRSIDPRYPFFDPRLAEFCLAIPPDQKIRNGWTRVIMRRAMDGVLPAEVQWRGGKSDLSPNFLKNALSLRNESQKVNGNLELELLEPYVDVQAVRADGQNRAGDRQAVALWKIIVLASWLQWFDEPAAQT